MTNSDHQDDGKYAAKFNCRDYFRHDDLETVFEEAMEMYQMRDYLRGDANVAVTIGPADEIDFPTVKQPQLEDMNRTQQIDKTRPVFKLLGLLTVVGTFYLTIWGAPLGLFPAIGVMLGIPDNPWFWPMMIVSLPAWYFLGLYSGSVWQNILAPEPTPKEDIDEI